MNISSSVYPNGMTSEQWNAHSIGTQLTGYANINPNTSVYPNDMTSEQWEAQANKDNVNHCFNRISYLLSRIQRRAN